MSCLFKHPILVGGKQLIAKFIFAIKPKKPQNQNKANEKSKQFLYCVV